MNVFKNLDFEPDITNNDDNLEGNGQDEDKFLIWMKNQI